VIEKPQATRILISDQQSNNAGMRFASQTHLASQTTFDNDLKLAGFLRKW
jgi:hypothetical protein